LGKIEIRENPLNKVHGFFNPLNTQLNPICHLLALLGAHHIFHVSGIRVKMGKRILLHFPHLLATLHKI
jgi:hypothetical protein